MDPKLGKAISSLETMSSRSCKPDVVTWGKTKGGSKVFGMTPVLGIFLCLPDPLCTLFLTALCPKSCSVWIGSQRTQEPVNAVGRSEEKRWAPSGFYSHDSLAAPSGFHSHDSLPTRLLSLTLLQKFPLAGACPTGFPLILVSSDGSFPSPLLI